MHLQKTKKYYPGLALLQSHNIKPGSAYLERYQYKSEVGDLVELPNGVPGIISDMDILCGVVKEITVKPFTTFWHRVYLKLTGKLTFYDHDIDRLVKL